MDNERNTEEDLELDPQAGEGDPPDAGEGDPPADDDPSTPEEKAYARRLGHVPESEWDDARAEREGRRRPAEFLNAREFLARTQEDPSKMRGRLQRQDKQIQDLTSKVNDMHSVVLGQRDMTIKAVARARQQGIAEAEQRMRDAVASGELGDYDKAKTERDKLAQTPVPKVPEPQEREEEEHEEDTRPAADPEATRWANANSWFNEDFVLQNAMISEEVIVKRKNPGLDLYAVLEKAKAQVMKRYPERFNINPRREAPGSVSPPSGARQSRTAFDQLSQADKTEYEKQRRMFANMKGTDGKPIVFTKEEFLEQYAH